MLKNDSVDDLMLSFEQVVMIMNETVLLLGQVSQAASLLL